MAFVEGYKWNILLLTICLLVGWNYWMPQFFWVAPFSLLGGPSSDFLVYYTAANSWLLGKNPYYDPAFVYTPLSLPFFSLFTFFNFRFASQLWVATYFAFFVVALVALALTLDSGRRLLYVSLAVLLFFTSYPLLYLMNWGQIDLLVESLAILSLVSGRLKHKFASAVLLSLSFLLKGTSILLLIYFVIFRRDWSYLVRFLISTLAIIGLSLLIVPVELYWYYAVIVVPRLSGILAFSINGSIPGMLAYAAWKIGWRGFNVVAQVVIFAGYILFAIFSFWASSKRFSTMNKTLGADGIFLLNVLVMLLFGPRSTVYPYVWIILPLALFLSALLMRKVRARYLLLVCSATFLLNSLLGPEVLNYQVWFPFEFIGNLLLTYGLISIYTRPQFAFGKLTSRKYD